MIAMMARGKCSSETFKVGARRRGSGGVELQEPGLGGPCMHSKEPEHFLVGDGLLFRTLSRGTKWSHLHCIIISRRHVTRVSLVALRGTAGGSGGQSESEDREEGMD